MHTHLFTRTRSLAVAWLVAGVLCAPTRVAAAVLADGDILGLIFGFQSGSGFDEIVRINEATSTIEPIAMPGATGVAFAVESADTLVVASNSGGLIRIDLVGGTLSAIAHSIPAGLRPAVAVEPSGQILVGAIDDSVYRVDPADGTTTLFGNFTVPSAAVGTDVVDIAIGGDAAIYVAAAALGFSVAETHVTRVDPLTLAQTSYPTRPLTNCIGGDPAGSVVTGCAQGLARLDLATGLWVDLVSPMVGCCFGDVIVEPAGTILTSLLSGTYRPTRIDPATNGQQDLGIVGGWVTERVSLPATTTPLLELVVSPDIAILLGGSVIDAAEVVEVIPVAAPPPTVDLGGLAVSAHVSAYHDAGGGVHLFSLDIATVLGAHTVSPRDVARYDTSTTTYAVEFDGSSAGLPDGVRIDALSRDASDNLLLSFDISVALPGGINVDDEDLVSWDGINFALVWDGSAAGVGGGLDLDGVKLLLSDGLLVSFDTSGSLNGVAFDDEDILEVDRPTTVTMDGVGWSVNFGNENYTVSLLSADPGSGGELRFRFLECCNGVFFNIAMTFDQPVSAVTSYSPNIPPMAYIASISFSGSTVNIAMQSNFGGQIEWGVEFASYPTSGTFDFSPTLDGPQTGALVFVPEPSPDLLPEMAWDGSASDAVWAAADVEAIDASPDSDGDGVADADDAFPNDPDESVDTDGDGIGNNADTEDDNDGILDSIEAAGPNDGDANADGIADSVQQSVASLPDIEGTDYIAVTVSGGCSEVQSVSVADEASMGQEDADFDYPLGLVSFTLPCATADVKVYFYSATPVAADYRKYGPTTPGDVDTIAWYSLPEATFGSETLGASSVTTASFTLQDGQLGDATGVDGQIVDPGGPPAAGSSNVPALPPLGITLLIVGLLGVGGGTLRKLHRAG